MAKKAFGLTEVLVGAVILAIVFAGLLSSFIGARAYVKRANKRLVAANLIRNVFNSLYKDIRQDRWAWDDAAGALRLLDAAGAPNTVALPGYTIDDLTYGPNNTYNVSAVAGRQYRQVTATVRYPVD